MAKQKRPSGPERRRHLVEVNLVGETRARETRARRGCFGLLGLFVIALAASSFGLLSLH
jgi:hypothetical protein